MADPKLKIDLNRGVEMRKDPITKMEVYMYYDDPGVFLNSFAKLIPNDIAARCGYDIPRLERMRMKKEKIAEFMAGLENEIGSTDVDDVIEERNGFKMVAVGNSGTVMVLDEEGNSLVVMPLPEKIGRELFEKLAGPAPKKAIALPPKVKSLAGD